MSIARIYQPITLTTDAIVTLDESASHHLSRVLRAAVGDEITLFNGEGGEYHARIAAINKKNVTVTMGAFNAREAESPIHITLAQGIARGEKMDFIIQKAVELGVNEIVPLITERCNVRINDERLQKKMAHWQSVIISACEQSGRNRVPLLSVPQALTHWLTQKKADVCFILSPHVDTKLSQQKIAQGSHIAMIIGPEGGLSDAEMEAAVRQGAQPLNMGPRILRTETAALTAIALLQTRYGDFVN